MRPRHRMQALVLFSLTPLLTFLAVSCTHPARVSHWQAAPLTLYNPATVSTGTVSLAVGTNRWSDQDTSLEEIFLPVAVTVRNNGGQTLCGGVATAVLSDSSGVSSSAVLPTEVVERLFGRLASLGPESRRRVGEAAFSEQGALLVLVHGSRGRHSGGASHSGRALGSGATRPHHFGPSHRLFVPPFYSPFYSPFSPFYPSPFSPFYYPFPPLSPYAPYDYGYAPYPLPRDLRPRGEEGPEVDQSLIKEIFTAAFSSHPLVPQEERSGFLFFPRPLADAGTPTLTWDWYDCTTHELIAHLSVPFKLEKKV